MTAACLWSSPGQHSLWPPALMFAPITVGVALVTRRSGHPSSAIAAIGVAASVTQAAGLSRWVYAVPGLAADWVSNADDPAMCASIETIYLNLHQSPEWESARRSDSRSQLSG